MAFLAASTAALTAATLPSIKAKYFPGQTVSAWMILTSAVLTKMSVAVIPLETVLYSIKPIALFAIFNHFF